MSDVIKTQRVANVTLFYLSTYELINIMDIDEPEVTQELIDEIESDGSTLPRFIAHWNTGVVYEAGVNHDACVINECGFLCYIKYVRDCNPLLKTRHWYRLPLLALGLAVYEVSPLIIREQFQKLT